jgi:ATP-binding cassette subfamily F protein 3
MAVVTIQGVTKQFGTQVVLAGVSLDLYAGETVGLVGANGAGKTTLFRLIAGEITPDIGTITCMKRLGIGFLKQEPEIALGQTLHDEVGSVFAFLLTMEQKLHDVSEQMAAAAGDDPKLSELMDTYERINARFIAAGGHGFETRLNEILGGLGFSQADFAKPMSMLSGGQKCRAALAKLLLRDRRLLLLDEPTNHLDIDAVRWLEKFLAGHHGTAVIVSHDRYLLDRLCDRIIEVEHCGVTSFPGSYTNYAKTKEIRLLTRQRRFEKDTEFIEKERGFIAKYLVGQRTRQAQGRRKRLERRIKDGEFVTEAPRGQRSARIRFGDTTGPEKVAAHKRDGGGVVLRCDELCMAYESTPLFDGLTFQVQIGGRLGITGPNGTGKTTLLRIILGEVDPTGGSFALDPRLRIGYYAQEGVHLDPVRTIVDEIRAAKSELSEQQARAYAAQFLFSGDDAFKTLGMLSGGEQSRIRLATLILQQPDVLILDEPTNHLDIPSREVLEAAFDEFAGTIIVVSHDRYLLDRVVNRLLIIRSEGHALYAGNYSYYIEQVERERVASRAKRSAPRKPADEAASKRGRAKSTPSPYDRLSIDELEALVIEHEERLAAIHLRFADPEVYRGPERLAELREEAEATERELAVVDAAWQERVDAQ